MKESNIYKKWSKRKLPQGLYVRKDSKYFWTKVAGEMRSTKTDVYGAAKEILIRRKTALIDGKVRVVKQSIEVMKNEFYNSYKKRLTEYGFKKEKGRIEIFIEKTKIKNTTDINFKILDTFFQNIDVSRKTKIHYKAAIKQFLKYLLDNRAISEMYIDKIKLPSPLKRKPFFFTAEQTKLLIDTAPDHLKTYYMLAMYTGIRLGELLKLKWEQIDWKNRLIHRKAEHAKDREDDLVSINKKLYDYLYPLRKKKGIIVRNSHGKPYRGYNGIKNAFNKHLTDCKIKMQAGVKFHAFRHTLASHLLMKTKDITLVKEVLGHTNIQQTQKYTHLLRDYMQEGIDKVDLS